MSEAKSAIAESAPPVKRPRNFKDLAGQTFGKLTVISQGPNYIAHGKKFSRWKCRCECGEERLVHRTSLLSGGSKSCGCSVAEFVSKSRTSHGHNRRHKRSRTYTCYHHMIERCYKPKCDRFESYGRRGIQVCDRWRGENGFENFLTDMGECPPGFQIDRKEVNGNYEPGNCRWATKPEQDRNRRTTRMLEIDGETLCLTDWSKRSGVGHTTIQARLKNGWEIKRAVFGPVW